MMKFNIGFYCQSVDFTEDVINLKTSLGGSETAMLQIAQALSNNGHTVHIFTKLCDLDGSKPINGVFYHSLERCSAISLCTTWDVFIVLRQWPFLIDNHIQARYLAIWNQDECVQPNQLAGALPGVDEMIFVSAWQANQYAERLHSSLKGMSFITKNPVDLKYSPLFNSAYPMPEKKPNKLIHVSRPERAILPLLQIFETMRKTRPGLELHYCRYNSMYDPMGWNKVCEQYDDAAKNVDGVFQLGELGKEQLSKEIAESALMVYPGIFNFAETSCIAALEAQACGTPLVASHRGALPETLKGGKLVYGDAMTPEYQEKFIKECFNLLDNKAQYSKLVNIGKEHVKAYTPEVIAGEWEAHLMGFFTKRFASNPQGIYRKLYHFDNMMAAARVAKKAGLSGEEFGKATKNITESQSPRMEAHYGEYSLPAGGDETATRLIISSKRIANVPGVKKVLDLAGGNGTFTKMVLDLNKDVHVTLCDYSALNIEKAKGYLGESGYLDRVDFVCSNCRELPYRKEFDAIFCGEILEHVPDPTEFIDFVETLGKEGAKVIFTTPNGPYYELLGVGIPEVRNHLHNFDMFDLMDLFHEKTQFEWSYISVGFTRRGYPIGALFSEYLITEGAKTGRFNYDKLMLTERPMQKLSAVMIVKNEEDNLGRCLKSFHKIVDEIIIADTGSTDTTKEVAARFGSKVKVYDTEWQEDFAQARNDAMQRATGDWVFWIDADEVLLGGEQLSWHTQGSFYNGYAVRQNHMNFDFQQAADEPIRLFRNGRGVKFIGVVHEQPEEKADEGIAPSMLLDRTDILHYGYTTERVRQDKAYHRNLELMLKDRKVNPERRLGMVLLQRDYINLAKWALRRGDDPRAKNYLEAAVSGYVDKFQGKYDDRFFRFSFKQYQEALALLGVGQEFDVLIGFAPNTNNGHKAPTVGFDFNNVYTKPTVLSSPARLRFLSGEEFVDFVKWSATAVAKQQASGG